MGEEGREEKTWRVIRTGKRREERVDLRKRKISTRFSPARNHLECSRATFSRQIKVLFWEEREREGTREREKERMRTVWTFSGIGEMASLSANFSVNRDRRNFLYPAPLPFHHRPLQWNQVAAPVAGVVERNRFRGNERRGSMMKYSLHCATPLAIFSPVWYDRTSCLWESIHHHIISKKFCRYFGYRGWLVKFLISSQYTYIYNRKHEIIIKLNNFVERRIARRWGYTMMFERKIYRRERYFYLIQET